ncbi:MAG: DnaJ domain-containing protein [Pseudonocardiales bacterium]|nr:DnaJ domain-containing protein [Pseudonocardiales bacterium]
MPAEDPDPYAVLGISPDASPAQIAHAYRRLIRAEHPDRHPHPDPAALTAAAAAYAILRDPARRAAYDQHRRPHHHEQPSPTPPPPRRGVPPTFRTSDPIRSGPEWRGLDARTAQEVHT